MANPSQFQLDTQDDIAIVRLSGAEMHDAAVVTAITEQLMALGDQEYEGVLLNCHNIGYSASALINCLLRARKHIHGQGGRLKLCEVGPVLQTGLRALNLDGGVFELYDTEADGLASFTHA